MRLLDLSNVTKSINSAKSAAMRQCARELQSAIRSEFKSKDKIGVLNKRNQYAGRRSASGQSLAKDSGAALSNVNYEISAKKVVVGIKKFRDNYVAYWEEKDRPTIANALAKSMDKIDSIFRGKNFTE